MSPPHGLEVHNSKRNPLLTRLKRPEVELLAISIYDYMALTDTEGLVSESIAVMKGSSQFKDLSALADEFSQEHTLGTSFRPFTLGFGNSAFSVFIPDYIPDDELSAFRAALAENRIPAYTVIARKTGRYWSYELVLKAPSRGA